MKKLISAGARNPEIIKIAERYCGKKDVKKQLFDFVFDKVVYKPDPITTQLLRKPMRSIREGFGNCTDYTILLGSLLSVCGIGYHLKVVSFHVGKKWEHIYIECEDGVILDAVQGQKQDGTDTGTNRGQAQYDIESKFVNKKIFKMPKVKILGRVPLGQDTTFVSSTTEDVQKILGLFDKCKLNCDLKHIFSRKRRRACKCQCACDFGSTYTPPGGETCDDHGVNLNDPNACSRGVTTTTTTVPSGNGVTTAGFGGGTMGTILTIGLVGAGLFLLANPPKMRRR